MSFLTTITQENLPHIVLRLANFLKEEAQKIVSEIKLPDSTTPVDPRILHTISNRPFTNQLLGQRFGEAKRGFVRSFYKIDNDLYGNGEGATHGGHFAAHSDANGAAAAATLLTSEEVDTKKVVCASHFVVFERPMNTREEVELESYALGGFSLLEGITKSPKVPVITIAKVNGEIRGLAVTIAAKVSNGKK